MGTLLFKKKKKDFLPKHESLLYECVWLNLSSFKDVMAGCIANLCWRNCFIISEPWMGTFDLFFPLFCPLSQHADNTVAAVVLKMMQSRHAGQDSLFSACFLFGLWQLWAFVCVMHRNKGGFRGKAASLGGADTIRNDGIRLTLNGAAHSCEQASVQPEQGPVRCWKRRSEQQIDALLWVSIRAFTQPKPRETLVRVHIFKCWWD